MAQFVAENGFESGLSFFAGLDDQVQRDAEVIRLHDQLVANQSKEKERQSKFKDLVELVDLVGPLEINLDNYLDEAKNLAANDSENNEIEALRNRLNSERQIRQNKRNSLFQAKLKPIQKSLENALNEDTDLATTDNLNRLISDINRLLLDSTKRVDGMAGISSLMKNNANNLTAKAAARIRQIQMGNQAVQELAKLKRHLNAPKQYADSLVSFAEMYPDNINAQNFLSTAKESDNWNAFNSWKTIAEKLNAAALEAISANDAGDLSKKIKLASQTKFKMPDGPILKLVQFLDKKQLRPAGGDKNRKLLRTFFERSEYEIIEIAVQENEFYYLAVPFDPSDKTFKYFKKTDRPPISTKAINTKAMKAPHCRISEQISKQLSAEKITNYDKLCFELINTSLGSGNSSQPSPYLDSLVQCEYLNQVLLFATLMSPELKPFAEKQRSEMQSQKLVGNKWKYKTEENQDLRRIASKFLERFKEDLGELELSANISKEDLAEMLQWSDIQDYQLVGFIYRNANKKWLIDTTSQLEDGVELYCVNLKADESVGLENVGTFNAKTTELNSSSNLQSGRPIYINSPTK